MIRKFFFIFFIIECSHRFVAGQVTFFNVYNCSMCDYPTTMSPTSDGGFIIGLNGGYSNNASPMIIRINAWGDTLWSRLYYGSNNYFIVSVIQSFDGGYAVAGNVSGMVQGGNNTYLLKTDSSGNILWVKMFQTGLHPNYPFKLIQKPDSGYAIAGTYEPSIVNVGGATLFMTDKSGNLLFSRKYGTDNSYFFSLQHTTDNGNVLCGNKSNTNLWITKRNANGFTWSKSYSAIPNSIDGTQAQILQAPDGGFLVGCTYTDYGAGLNRDYCIAKFDSTGNSIWVKTYGITDDDEIQGISMTSDGGIVCVGTSTITSILDGKINILRTDSAGNLLWAKTYGGAQGEGGLSINETADHGFIVLGYGTSYPPYYAYLLKTDSLGNAGCNLTIPVVQVANPSINVSTTPPQDSVLAVTVITPTLSQSSGCGINTLCFYNPVSETKNSSNIMLFPNPATSQFSVTASVFSEGEAAIYNLTGEKIYSGRLNGNLFVNCESFPRGIYFVKISFTTYGGTNRNHVMRKLVVQ